MTRARDLMTRNVVCAQSSSPAKNAFEKMCEFNFRHLPVVDEGLLVGIVSDRDLGLLVRGDEDLTVGDVMTRDPITCAPSATVEQLARLMLMHKIDSMPIVADRRLVGLVTTTDLLELLLSGPGALRQTLPFDFTVLEVGAQIAG